MLGEANEWSPPRARFCGSAVKAPLMCREGPAYASFALSFCTVLLKTILITESHI